MACAMWILCGVYTSGFILRGWIPHDEGTIGQSAERVLLGQTPHRDFDELYTGGVTYLHAGAMKAFGVSLRTPRWILFAFFMAFLAATYAVASRVSSAPVAAGALALVTVWSVPNYFVSLPSWYTLFFATFGILALMRVLESDHRVWLAVAGVCGGLSLLAKITGAYYVLGALLFLVYVEQIRAPARLEQSSRSWFWLAAAVPAAFIVLLISQEPSFSAVLSFAPLFVPPLFACGFVMWGEWKERSGNALDRAKGLFRLAWPFAAGMGAILIPFVLLYWRVGALPDLVHGTFIQPQRRLTEASLNPPGFVMLGLSTPYVVLLLLNERRMLAREWRIAIAVAVVLGAVLLFGTQPIVYRAAWTLARSLPLIATLAGVALLAKHAEIGLSESQRARVFLLTSMAGMLSLVQFPYASPTYFFYCAPIVVLALVSIVSAQRMAPLKVHLVIAVFFFVFAVVFANRSYGWNLGVRFIPYAPDTRLALDRGGLVVSSDDARTYEAVVDELHKRAAGGTIYAAPDCPEVYFLSGFLNPTRAIFDFLSLEPRDEVSTKALLDRSRIRAVVINTAPAVSPPVDASVQAVLERRFTQSKQIGRFVVRWSDDLVR
ncbi:MAG: hypothetical protein ACRD2N_02665 [Vicinamibacterales bacterium]